MVKDAARCPAAFGEIASWGRRMNASTMREIGHAIAELTDRIDDLDQRIAIAFKQLKGRVNTLEARVDRRMDQLESETKRVVASFGNRVDGVATGFKQVN